MTKAVTDWYQVPEYEEPYPGLFGAPHTMASESLDRYVTTTKFSDAQRELLDCAIDAGWPIEIHGIFEQHFPSLLESLQFTLRRREDREAVRRKRFNKHRPFFVHLKDRHDLDMLWVCVFPSREYVQQVAALVYYYYCHRKMRSKGRLKYSLRGYAPKFATLIYYYISKLNIIANQNFSVPPDRIRAVHYPKLEQGLAEWSGLCDTLNSELCAGDFALIGHVDEVSKFLDTFGHPAVKSVPIGEVEYGELIVHEIRPSNVRLVLVGVAHSFWGSASGIIAATLAAAKVREIFYVAKAGTLVSEDLVHSLVSPESYTTLDKPLGSDDGYWNWKTHDVKSGMHSLAPQLLDGLRSGNHLTVPTVVGETIRQHEQYKILRPATIDNEIGYIARSIVDVNAARQRGQRTSFTCFHFITDFLNAVAGEGDAKKAADRPFDLATAGSAEREIVASSRDKAFRSATTKIITYLQLVGAETAPASREHANADVRFDFRSSSDDAKMRIELCRDWRILVSELGYRFAEDVDDDAERRVCLSSMYFNWEWQRSALVTFHPPWSNQPTRDAQLVADNDTGLSEIKHDTNVFSLRLQPANPNLVFAPIPQSAIAQLYLPGAELAEDPDNMHTFSLTARKQDLCIGRTVGDSHYRLEAPAKMVLATQAVGDLIAVALTEVAEGFPADNSAHRLGSREANVIKNPFVKNCPEMP